MLWRQVDESPSSRRAWIEIGYQHGCSGAAEVALLAEGVDRNIALAMCANFARCRPPRGGRG